VECKKGVLSEPEFALRGESCQVLLAPLSEKMGYGSLKGSGAIGDAVYLKRKMIIPSFVDTKKEFKEFCMYYAGDSELAELFSRVASVTSTSIEEEKFSKFETPAVYSSLVSDLRLCSIL